MYSELWLLKIRRKVKGYLESKHILAKFHPAETYHLLKKRNLPPAKQPIPSLSFFKEIKKKQPFLICGEY